MSLCAYKKRGHHHIETKLLRARRVLTNKRVGEHNKRGPFKEQTDKKIYIHLQLAYCIRIYISIILTFAFTALKCKGAAAVQLI